MEPIIKDLYKLFIGQRWNYPDQIRLFIRIKSGEGGKELNKCILNSPMNNFILKCSLSINEMRSEVP